MKTSGQSRIMGAAFSRLSGRFFQAASLAIALLSLGPLQAETRGTLASSERQTDLNASACNLLSASRSEILGRLSFCQDLDTLGNWPAKPDMKVDGIAQLCAFAKVPGPFNAPFARNIESGVAIVRSGSLKLEADAFEPVFDSATDLPVNGDFAGVWEGVPGESQAGTAQSRSTIAVTQFTRVPEPCIVILSGVGLAVALFGRKRGRRVYGR